MKKASLVAAVLGFLAINAPQAMATSTTITDTYIGADPTHNWAHVDSLGAADFNLTKMVVDFENNKMKVDIYADRYFGKTLPFESTLLGDLFISTNGIKAYPNNDSRLDTKATGEQWEWVAALDTHNKTSGLLGLYLVDQNKIVDSNLQGLPDSQWVYRAGQEWIYDTTGLTSITTGTWSRDNEKLSLSFNMPNWDVTEFGLHWGMSCGNDVIEGTAAAPVPEPATMLLFGTGLTGLAAMRRKKKA